MPVTRTADNSGAIGRAVQALLKSQVVVGIPDTTAERQPEPGEKGTPPSNAQIGYWMETGVPEKNIPARPFLVPGTESVRNQVAMLMTKAGEAALTGNPVAVEAGLERVGLVAADAVRLAIRDGSFAPLSQRTIEQRAKRTKTNSGTKGAKDYLRLQAEGTPDWALQSANLVKPLIDTGKLLAAIVHVVRSR